jgi:hypothetical protein
MNAKVLNPIVLNQAGTLLQRAQEYLTGSGTLAGAIALNLDIERFMNGTTETVDNPYQVQLGQPAGASHDLAVLLGLDPSRVELLRAACAEAIEKDIHLKMAGSKNCGPDHMMHRATAHCISANETTFCVLSVHEALNTLARKHHVILTHLKPEPVQP